MNTATLGRDPFMPQAPRGRGKALALALLAHVLLVLALAFGVNWRSSEPPTVAAELWSVTPQAAAPRAVEPPPPAPAPEPPKRAAPAVVAPPKPAPAPPDPQIAIEKAKRDTEKKRERFEREQAEREEKQKQRARDDALAQKKAQAEKAERERAEAADRAANEKAQKAEKAEAARLAALRDANLKRLQGLAGATGGAADTGSALRSSGPSNEYGGRIAARIKPNIVFTDVIDGNPRAEVELRLAPDGSIAGKRLVKSSGVRAWDDAVLRAIERTEIFPLDNGRVPPPIVIGFRPRDL